MPGPSNVRRKRKSQPGPRGKKSDPPKQSRSSLDSQISIPTTYDSSSPTSCSPNQLLTPSPTYFHATLPDKDDILPDDGGYSDDGFIPQIPYIHDPGNGPRVRDTHAFLTSSYFAQSPALEIPLCAEFAQDEVLQMLRTILPEELALILWYNKSRATSRICPACQRLYRLGDTLPDHINDEHEHVPKSPSPQLEREREISGLCSPVCFILASFNFPGAIRSAWGRMEDELDDMTWALLNGPGEGNDQGDTSISLGLLVKMTRLHDLGLAQLCLGSEEYVDDEVDQA